MSRYIDIEPYEKDGWYLQKHYHNSYGEVIKTTPLVSVPTAEPNSCEYWDSESRFCALRRPQAEPTYEQVEEYCRKRCLVIVDGALFNEMKSRWSAELVKHGQWIEDEYGIPHCSECGTINNTVYKNYCPNCGAKMDEVEND